MIAPWVTDELRAHPYRMWLIHAVALLIFTLILIHRMPAYEYTTYVYPTKSPRVDSVTSNKAVENKEIAVSKKVSVRPSRPPRDGVPDPLPNTRAPSARPSPIPSEPSEPSPGPSVPSEPPSEPPQPPDDLPIEPPVTPPDNSNDEKPQTVDVREANEFGPRRPKSGRSG